MQRIITVFRIYRGNLKLKSADVERMFQNSITAPINPANLDRTIKKFLYFYNNTDKISHPVTAFINERIIKGVHPGAVRFVAASYQKLEFIDCIFLIKGKASSIEYLKEIADNTVIFNDAVFFKNPPNDQDGWWELSSVEHKLFVENHRNESFKFFQQLDDSLNNFLKNNKNYQWVYNDKVILKGSDPKYQIKINTLKCLFDSIVALNDNKDLGIQIETIN